MLRLNIGCGKNKFPGFVNIDIDPIMEPDLVADITQTLPYDNQSVDEIWFIHGLEHISYHKHEQVLREFNRVLKMHGNLILAYPEFTTVAKYYIDNYKGKRDFWRACCFGRQLTVGDVHLSPINTSELVVMLKECGFENIRISPEPPPNDFYTMLKAARCEPWPYREEIIRKEIFFS